MSALAFATSGYSAKYLRMVSLEHPRLRAAGAMSPRETSSASIISCGVYLWYVATCERSAFTNSDMLSFLFLVAKLSTLIARRHTFALWRDMCSAESPAAPLSRSALRESTSYRPYPTTPPYPRHDAAPALLRARPLALGDGLPVPRREARGSTAPTPARALAWVRSRPSSGLPVWSPGLP